MHPSLHAVLKLHVDVCHRQMGANGMQAVAIKQQQAGIYKWCNGHLRMVAPSTTLQHTERLKQVMCTSLNGSLDLITCFAITI